MKKQDVAIYREVQRNTEMAMKAIDTISDKVYDKDLAQEISQEAVKYAELHNAALKQLVAAKADPYCSNSINDWMLKAGIHYNTVLNTSTGHMAELLIKGSNNAVLDMEKVLKHNQEAGGSAADLAKELIKEEQKSIGNLKAFL